MYGQILGHGEEWNSVIWRAVKTYKPTYDRFIFAKENKNWKFLLGKLLSKT